MRCASVSQQERSAWIASATVHHLAERDGGMHDRRIGEAGKDSLGHLLGAYIADIDRVAQGTDDVTVPGPTSTGYTTASWLSSLPVGAGFTQKDLNQVLSEVLTDDTAGIRLAEAAAQFNAARVEAAVGEYNADAAVGISGPLGSSSRLVGYLAGNLEQGSVDAGKEVDERNKQFIGLTSDLVGLIPTGKTLTSFLADQAKSAGADWVTEQMTGNAAAAAAQESAEMTALNMQIAAAVALADSPHLPESVRTDHYGKGLPVVPGGGLGRGGADRSRDERTVHPVDARRRRRYRRAPAGRVDGVRRRQELGQVRRAGGAVLLVAVAGLSGACSGPDLTPVPMTASAPYACEGVPLDGAELMAGEPLEVSVSSDNWGDETQWFLCDLVGESALVKVEEASVEASPWGRTSADVLRAWEAASAGRDLELDASGSGYVWGTGDDVSAGWVCNDRYLRVAATGDPVEGRDRVEDVTRLLESMLPWACGGQEVPEATESQ